MHFQVMFGIEAPAREVPLPEGVEGPLQLDFHKEAHDWMERVRLICIEGGETDAAWTATYTGHGCWEDEQIQARRMNALISRAAFEKLMGRCDLHLTEDEVEVMDFPHGYPSLRMDGPCRYTERWPESKRMVVDAFVTPYPDFDPKNRVEIQEQTAGGPLAAAAWFARSWRRIKRALLSVYC